MMKKVISTLLAGAMSLSMVMPAFAADTAKRVYVSPTGDDRYEGETANNAVATPGRARDLARALKADGSEVQVVFMEGVYELDGNFELGEEDSGTETAPVIYRAAKDAEVKFTTGKKLTAADFSESQALTSASGIVFEAELSKLGIAAPTDRNPSIMTLNGEMVSAAASVEELTDGEYIVADGVIYYAPEGYVVEGEIYLSDNYNVQSGPNTNIAQARATVKMNGVSNVKFENIDVFGGVSSAYMLNGCDNVTIYGANISAMNGWGVAANLCNDITVLSCDIGNMQGVENSQFHTTGGISMNLSTSLDFTKLEGVQGGENVELVDENNLVKNCTLHECAGVGIAIGGMGTTVENNLIKNSKYGGITFVGNDHLIQNNRIVDVIQGQSDNGAIYSGRSWTDRGTIIKNNFIYNTTGLTDNYEAWGDTSPAGLYAIYLDDMLSGVTVEGNIAYNLQGGMMIGGGSDNVIKNNIANGQIGMHYDARGAGSPWDNSKHLTAPDGVMYKDIKALVEDDSYVAENWANYSGWTAMIEKLEEYEAGTITAKELGKPRNVVIDGNLFFGEKLALEWYDGIYDNYVRIDSLVENTGTAPAAYTDAASFANGEVTVTGLSADYPATTVGMGLLADDGYTESFFENEYVANEGNSFTAVAAIYNGDGVLKSISTAEDAYVYDGQIVGMDVQMPEAAAEGETWFIKLMLWDSMQGRIPVARQTVTIGK